MPGFLKAIREAAAAAPVNQDLVFTRRKLWDDIERTLWARKQPRTILSRPQSRR